MRSFSYVLLDVFTSQPLAGNQLAVFTDGRGLSDAEMQMLAKETNLSETTFIIQRDEAVERERGVQVRIFTTQEELPFAGHPTLGTATVLRRNKEARIELDLRVGKIPVTFEERGSEPAFGEMVQRNPEFGAIHKASDIAPIAGLKPEDFESDLPIQTVSTGMAFMIAPVKSPERIQAIDYQSSVAKKYLQHSDAKFIFFVCKQTVDPQARLHARMIFYNGEDPATGSASGCAAAWMAKYGVAGSNERVLIEQGIEMDRPSRIFVSAEKSDDKVVNVRVGGQAVEVARGEFRIP
ncbi:MAG: Phenazine biosynthesis PhzC/PhzF protein [Candidatus Angelobacter sp.]|jgi:trans-2,3-dihydro-3-hydroxyanthranilate isomerase|nr:Phenazine biosynthesis PhzC/PhzF protein [Candidatus Angelobacter sp.]